MNLELVENLASRGVKGDFKFTNADSFHLFVEGVGGLRLYERSAAPGGLATAEEKLEACVSRFPLDVLPQFYLGIVKVLRSYEGADDAIRLFRSIADRRVPELRPAALYNLASACIELYTAQAFEDAQTVLRKCIEELQGARQVERVSLRFQARILLLFCQVRQQLWVKRKEAQGTLQTELTQVSPDLEKQLDSLREETERAPIPEGARADVLADYWNTRGILKEFLASTTADEARRANLTEAAVQSFQEALRWKWNWIPAKSNVARVYQDLLHDYDAAIRCWREMLEIRPGDNYTEYMLGRLFSEKGDHAEAASHYERAPHIPEAKRNLAVLYGEKLNRRDDAVALWQQVLSEAPGDEQALKALAALGALPATPASDAGPTA